MVICVEVWCWWALRYTFHGGIVSICARGADSNALVGNTVEIRGHLYGACVNAPLGVGLRYLPIWARRCNHTLAGIVVGESGSRTEIVTLASVWVREHIRDDGAVPHTDCRGVIGVPVPLLQAISLANSGPILGVIASRACLLARVVDGLSVIPGRTLLNTIPGGVVSECSLRAEIGTSLCGVVPVLISCTRRLTLRCEDVTICKVRKWRALCYARACDILREVVSGADHWTGEHALPYSCIGGVFEIVHVFIGGAQWDTWPSGVVRVEVYDVCCCIYSSGAMRYAPSERVVYEFIELSWAIQHTPVDIIVAIIWWRGWTCLYTLPACIQCEVVACAAILAGHCEWVGVESRHWWATVYTLLSWRIFVQFGSGIAACSTLPGRIISKTSFRAWFHASARYGFAKSKLRARADGHTILRIVIGVETSLTWRRLYAEGANIVRI